MVDFAHAKINLGLNILRRREDGYHELETVFYPVDLSDIIEVVPSQNFDLVVTGMDLDIEIEENLVFRAYTMLKSRYNFSYVHIFLHKQIPFGGGLGGGSSDAATVLKLLNEIFELGLSYEQLAEFAVKIGADCKFFLNPRPMYATGIGDILEPVDLDLSEFNIVIVKPGFNISTRRAYSLVRPIEHKQSLKEIISLPVSMWRDRLENDFERFLFNHYPQLKQIKEQMYEMGALYSSVTGSGSAVYGIFEDKIDLKQFDYPFTWQSKY
jgi:4-diphosphocytidyl-2-C-methyl-D-erythritol kinase